jgi:hypothetical protein
MEPRNAIGEGDLVVVARAQNQAEGELLQNLLRAEGVPSLLRRAPGYDVPDFLAAGPRDVLVPASAQQDARDVLLPSQRQGADQ